MPIGAGLSGQIGAKAETVVGTQVTVDTFYEYNSESLGLEKNIQQGRGIRAGGLYDRSQRRNYTTRTAGGTINMDVPTTGFEAFLKQMMGAVTGTTTKTYTPAALTGQSLTIQKGVPQTDGTVKAFTYPGCKIPNWTLSCDTGGILVADMEIDAWDELPTTTVALATASYTASNVFSFEDGAITLGGVAVANVKAFSTTTAIGMKNDRFFFGSAGKKAEQIENDYRTTTGTLTTEFVSQATIYDLFRPDTSTGLVMTFTNGSAVLSVTCPAIFFDGETPKVGGPDVVDLTAPFTALDNGSNPAITIVYTAA